jgi:hypothetical protein
MVQWWQPACAMLANSSVPGKDQIVTNDSEHRQDEALDPTALGMMVGLIFGAALGIALGVILGNMAFMSIGIGAGLSIGLSIGAGLEKRRKNQN